MVEQFLNHINSRQLCTPDDRILMAVSGGIDSMVMLSLFHQLSFKTSVAHCNFGLRGAESDEDEALVCREAKKYEMPFYSKHFDTASYAGEHGVSVQMAARVLRYQWFNELAEQYGYNYIATAHHLNDSIETVLLNLARGTGLEGLTGIAERQGKLIRPMLFATRAMIDAYAAGQAIAWREDSSNADNKYQRNLVRTEVIPLLRRLNPGFENTFKTTLERIQGSWQVFKEVHEQFIKESVLYDGFRLLVKKKELSGRSNAAILLWELLKDRGFNYDQCVDITTATHQVGKLFYAGSCRLTIDRRFLIVDQWEENHFLYVTIDDHAKEVKAGDKSLLLRGIDRDEFILNKDRRLAQLDAGQIKFPLTWRTWKAGDHFIPLGMQQHKKVSDFLVDEKVPLPEKEQVTVLVAASGEIVWVVGMRVADPFKVTEATQRVLVIEEAENFSQENQESDYREA